MEGWKQVKDNPGYWVSTNGRVIKGSYYSTTYKVGGKRNRGHLRVRINGKARYVHRLVAETFIPNPDNKPFVCHKDDDPSNNRVSNLYWGDYKDNARDRLINNPQYTDPQVKSHIPVDDVFSILYHYYVLEQYQKDIATLFGVSQRAVSGIVTGSRWNRLTRIKRND